MFVCSEVQKRKRSPWSFPCSAPNPRQPIDPPHSFSAAPLSRGRLLPGFGFFAGMQKGTPTRAPQVVMSTRLGCFPEITCEQLAVIHKAKQAERLDAETVFLACPTLSEEAGRMLPNPVERSLLSYGVLTFLEAEETNRRRAEEKVRQNPDSPALYLHTRWWEAVRDWHEALRMLTLAQWEWADDTENVALFENQALFGRATELADAAREEQWARGHALLEELS